MAMNWEVVFKPQALEHLRRLPVHRQRIVTDGIRRHLLENGPRVQTRNKFQLRRSSVWADSELRLGSLRVLDRTEGSTVFIAVIGLKRGSTLTVQGEDFEL